MIESLVDPCVLGFFWVHDWILDHPYVLGFVCAWFNVKSSILLIWVLFWVRRELGTKKCFGFLFSDYERAWHKNLFCFIINHTAHSLLHPSRTLENQSLSWSSPQLEWFLLGFTMSWLKMMKMMILKLNVVAAWTPSDDEDDERWGWWLMTKTLIISVIIIVVVQAQAPRALLQSVPNKKKSAHVVAWSFFMQLVVVPRGEGGRGIPSPPKWSFDLVSWLFCVLILD